MGLCKHEESVFKNLRGSTDLVVGEWSRLFPTHILLISGLSRAVDPVGVL